VESRGLYFELWNEEVFDEEGRKAGRQEGLIKKK
jgi:hypothetical protein